MFSITRLGPFFFDPVVLFSIGVLFELVCFSLALSQRTRLIQLENQRLQQDYTRQLEQDLAARLTTIQTQNQLLEEERLQRLINDFNQKIAETEMAALRSQMNPHFIFNCLNSIQFFTAQNNAEKASDYLTKFSRLIRLVLENSKSERVTLTNELETLRLYIEMEAMRFPNKLSYQILLADDVDADSIHLPPLLLQPYVENAIWHGLMHKDEGGTVRIMVDQPQADFLQITITDDGVGRQKATAYKSKSATQQKSFGMKITADRIELINQLYAHQTNVLIDDLFDLQGQPAGTKVVITTLLQP
jgi:sensor histidine kinase YesM